MLKNKRESLQNTTKKIQESPKEGREIPLNKVKEQFKNLFFGKINRETISSGAMGLINKIEDEKGFKICEKEFRPESRYLKVPLQEHQAAMGKYFREPVGLSPYPLPEQKSKTKINKLIFDFFKNEIKALEQLEGISGIPRLYGSITEKKKNALYEEFIEGPDLYSLFSSESPQQKEKINELIKSEENLEKIFSQIKDTLKQAAERGVIWGGGSIILDKNFVPYLVEWYDASFGSIEEEDFKKLYNIILINLNEVQDQFMAEIIKEKLKAS